MVSFTQVLTLATGASALAVSRDASQIINSLNAITQATYKLIDANNEFANGTNINYEYVLNATYPIVSANVGALQQSFISEPLTQSDANDVVNFVNTQLQPAIATSVKSAEKGKKNYKQVFLQGAVVIQLQELKSFSAATAKNLVGGAPNKAAAANIQKAYGKIDQDYAAGIEFFSF